MATKSDGLHLRSKQEYIYGSTLSSSSQYTNLNFNETYKSSHILSVQPKNVSDQLQKNQGKVKIAVF